MKKLMFVIACSVLAGLSVVLCPPVLAQFEVSPDHFSDGTSASGTRASAHPKEAGMERAALSQELESYRALIRNQEQAAEQAREEACGAGAMEDSSYIFIDEYMRQLRALERLKKNLTPQIIVAEALLEMFDREKAEAAASSTATPIEEPTQVARSTRRHGVMIASLPKSRK